MDQILAAPLFDPKENYALTDKVGVIRQSDGAYITDSMDNMEWREYLAWRDAGNEPEPYVAPPEPIPQVVSRRQFFQAAAKAGMITPDEAIAAVTTNAIPAALENVIDALPDGKQFDARMAVAGSLEFHRDHPMMAAAADALSKTDAEMDALFLMASKIF